MTEFGTAQPYAAAYNILRDGDKVAFVLRAHTGWMEGMYGLPAGKVEIGESFSVAAIREAKEEVGVHIKPENLRHVLTVHRHPTDNFDWVDVFFEVDTWEGEVVNNEPDMHSEVAWLDINNLPENVIPSVRAALAEIALGRHYVELGWEQPID